MKIKYITFKKENMNLKELGKEALLEAAYEQVAKNQNLVRKVSDLQEENDTLVAIIEDILKQADEVRALPWWKKALKAVAMLSRIIDFIEKNLPKKDK